MNKILNRLGPDNPFGPVVGAFLVVIMWGLAAGILVPPIMVAGEILFGWWWRLWLN